MAAQGLKDSCHRPDVLTEGQCPGLAWDLFLGLRLHSPAILCPVLSRSQIAWPLKATGTILVSSTIVWPRNWFNT